MSGHGRKPTRLREQSIVALITQPTVELAARQAGVSYSTLNRWIRDEQFAAEVKAARNELLQSAIDRLKSSALEGVNVLIAIASNVASSESARVAAAKALIDYALRVAAIEDLAARIEDLERKANEEFEGSEHTLAEVAENHWSSTCEIHDA
jgi:hypothetical protein